MTQALDELDRVLRESSERLLTFSEENMSRSAPGKWSPKQILGHLIDSASNNHQRWVRAQFTPRLEFPKYDQNAWVATQQYATESWPDLVNLWLLYNRHLLHVARAFPPEMAQHVCVIGDNAPATVEALVTGYVQHMQHHLEQIKRAS